MRYEKYFLEPGQSAKVRRDGVPHFSLKVKADESVQKYILSLNLFVTADVLCAVTSHRKWLLKVTTSLYITLKEI